MEILKKCKTPLIQSVIAKKQESIASLGHNNYGSKLVFQLKNLLKVLQSTDVNYTLCVNPNNTQSSTKFDWNMVKKQVKTLSIVPTGFS